MSKVRLNTGKTGYSLYTWGKLNDDEHLRALRTLVWFAMGKKPKEYRTGKRPCGGKQ